MAETLTAELSLYTSLRALSIVVVAAADGS